MSKSTVFMSRLYSQFLNENKNKEESNNKHNYVYWVSDGFKWYIGVRSSTIEPEKDFWKYGTSSYRKQEIISKPEMFKVYILADFDNRKEANAYEVFLHSYFNVKYSKKFWNKSNAGADFYSNTKGTVSVFDKEDNEYKRVSNDEYFSNLDRYSTPTTGSVTVALKTDMTHFFNVSKEEFYLNRHLYTTTACHRENKGGVNVYEISTQKIFRITTEEYYNNKDRYITTGTKLRKYLSQQVQQS